MKEGIKLEELIYKKILQELPFGYALHKTIFDEKNIPEDYEYIEANKAFEKFTGLKIEGIIGKRITEIIPNIKNDTFDWIRFYGDIALNGGEKELKQYSEELKKYYKIKVFSPKKGYFITFFIDISDEVKEKNLYKSILTSINEGIVSIDREGKITSINKAAKDLICYKENIFNENKTFLKNDDNDKIINDLLKVIKTGEIIKSDRNIILKKDNKEKILSYTIYPIFNREEVEGTVINFLDVTDKVNKDKAIDYITYHDSLTGVFNRNFFNKELKNIDKEENLPISVIMGDVNGLKLTNDAFGHLAGDKLLITAANTMKKVCRENDIIVRWGGDEFIIILPKTKEKYAEKVCERIKEECEKEFIEAINLSISLGYSTKYNIEQDIIKAITDSEDMMYGIKMLESKSQKSKTLKIIMETLYERSRQDVEHSKNVAKLCKMIGEALELSVKELSELEILGNIHDIGKIGVNKNILNKTSELTEAEWFEIKKHSEIGYHIASSTNEFSFLGEAILAHHEWYNGSGYPKGLKGEQIPKMARILAIADAYDAMISYNRPYRKSKTKEEAINELIKYKGMQFDPELVDIFVDKVIKKI